MCDAGSTFLVTTQGAVGKPGDAGKKGEAGIAGKSGRRGANGQPGEVGDPGPAGAKGQRGTTVHPPPSNKTCQFHSTACCGCDICRVRKESLDRQDSLVHKVLLDSEDPKACRERLASLDHR